MALCEAMYALGGLERAYSIRTDSYLEAYYLHPINSIAITASSFEPNDETFSELGGLASIPNDPQGTFSVIWECTVCLSNRKPVDFLTTTTSYLHPPRLPALLPRQNWEDLMSTFDQKPTS
jgi:hypothetical protein